MSIERFQLFIGQLLLMGLLLAIVFTSIGGVMYLLDHGEMLVSYHDFQPTQKHFLLDFSQIFSGTSAGFIQLGLYILIITQLLRVLLTVWMFKQLQDRVFVFCSLFIFGVLVYCLV
jgi:uncharacterized membrane protein